MPSPKTRCSFFHSFFLCHSGFGFRVKIRRTLNTSRNELLKKEARSESLMTTWHPRPAHIEEIHIYQKNVWHVTAPMQNSKTQRKNWKSKICRQPFGCKLIAITTRHFVGRKIFWRNTIYLAHPKFSTTISGSPNIVHDNPRSGTRNQSSDSTRWWT